MSGAEIISRAIVFSGPLYALTLSIFRHVTLDDKGLLSTINDLIPHLVIAGAEIYSSKSLDAKSTNFSRIVLFMAGIYLAKRLHASRVAGRKFEYIDLNGKVYIVTGSNTGIGFETARELARMKATVVLACRSVDKANKAKYDIINSTKCNPNKIIVIALDLCSFASVRKFVGEFHNTGLLLHGLINNAGVMINKREVTAEGLEVVMTANHFSHFLLTNLLLPDLRKTNGRIVVLSSALHRASSQFHFDDIMSEKSYSLFGTYSQSKLANMLFGFELQRRLTAEGSKVTCNIVHPGNVYTDVSRNMGKLMTIMESGVAPLLYLLRKTPLQGAASSIYATISPELEGVGGKYIANCEICTPSTVALDEGQAKKLWEISEKITGL